LFDKVRFGVCSVSELCSISPLSRLVPNDDDAVEVEKELEEEEMK
jgi:hypothetical protein